MSFFKVTEDNLDELSYSEILSKLEAKPREMVEEIVEWEKKMILSTLEECESPIEMILALAMRESYFLSGDGVDRVLNIKDGITAITIVGITNQAHIAINNKTNYRVDFLIPVYDNRFRHGKQFVIECDGHEFHEKTKKQVARDNKRKRDLTAAGYIILNFSGSEIFNNSHGCVHEIEEIIRNTMKKMAEDARNNV